MKVVILCGGRGTRIREVSEILPKPMLPIGDKPILWHIMKTYAHFGFNDFVLCLGYKGWLIKEFFLNYYAKTSDLTVTLGKKDTIVYHNPSQEKDWKVTLVDTGEDALTGTRLARIEKYLDADSFGVTYGDGVADIDLKTLALMHQKSKSLATITGVHPSGRFGEIHIQNDKIISFNEKPNTVTGLINGGFMMLNREVIKRYIPKDKDLSLESDVLPKLAKDKKLGMYKHEGYWQCVDTPREYDLLQNLWEQKKAPWRVWK